MNDDATTLLAKLTAGYTFLGPADRRVAGGLVRAGVLVKHPFRKHWYARA